MMTAIMTLLTVSGIAVWWKKAQWAWMPVMLALMIGVYIFAQDVDFSTDLGIRL